MEFIKKHIYKKLPDKVRIVIKNIFDRVPFTPLFSKRSWVRNRYTQFGLDQREYVFLSCARFANINRPIDGYYFEFGCHGANTMRMAWRNFRYLFDRDYVAFDSFEGLPEIDTIDKQQIWKKGKLKTEEEVFKKKVFNEGMPKDKLKTVRGYYEQTLTAELKNELSIKKAAVVYIDCDLYTSTVPVLEFIKDFLQLGTIIIFDDWYCFHGDPEKGEQKAFSEFREKYPELQFVEFVSTNEAKSFIYIEKEKNEGAAS